MQQGYKDIGDMAAYKIPMAGSGVMVDKEYLAAHRDTVLRFLKADIEATALMQRDRRVFRTGPRVMVVVALTRPPCSMHF